MAFDKSKQIVYSVRGVLTPDRASVQTVVDAIPEEKVPLIVWFHGGLVATSAGEQIAARVGTFYHEGYPGVPDPSAFPPKVHPIFFVWESGVGRSLIDSIAEILKREVVKRAVEKLSDLLHFKIANWGGLGIDGTAGASKQNPEDRLSDEEIEVLREVLSADPAFNVGAQRFALSSTLGVHGAVRDDVDDAIAEFLDRHNPPKTPGFDVELALQMARAMAVVAGRVLERRRHGRDHGVKQTIIEETVRELKVPEVWRQIKGYTDAAFQPSGVATTFLRALRASGKGEGREIYLVGHSTGAVYIANLLMSPDAAGMTFHVRFLAPAIRFDRWKGACGRLRATIASFRSYGMLDEVERGESLLDISPLNQIPALRDLYKGSLLYMVSGALETTDEADPDSAPYPDCPVVGMQRFVSLASLSGTESVLVGDVRAPYPNGWVCGPCGQPYPTDSRTHGGFDDDGESALWSLLLP